MRSSKKLPVPRPRRARRPSPGRPRLAHVARPLRPPRASLGKKATPAEKAPKARPNAAGARDGSKTTKVLDLLKQGDAVTLQELMKATGRQAHSVRGFLSGTVRKKLGLEIISTKGEDGGAHLLRQSLGLAVSARWSFPSLVFRLCIP